MESTDGHYLVEEIAEAARQHNQLDDDYLAKIRRLTAQLASSDLAPNDLRGALLAVEDHARIDLDVPTGSRRKAATFVKLFVKRLTAWYLGYIGDQITLLGQAIVRMGTALVDHTERLEHTTATLADDVATLAARVERLERGSSGS
jgi:hypothetical protein